MFPKKITQPSASNASDLPTREKVSYAFGDFACVLYWQTISVHLLFFYTDVFGISAAAVGAMVLFSRSLDAINDPLVGMIADRTNTRWGKYRPYVLWMAVPLAVMGVLMFTTPDLDERGKIIWAWVTFNGLMIAYTVLNIPFTAMLGVISPDSKVRTAVASIKFGFAYMAALLIQAGLLPLVRWIGGSPESQHGWQVAFMIIGVVAVVMFVLVFVGTRERVKPVVQQQPIRADLADLVRNGPWLLLVPMTFLFILFVASRLIVINHYFKYVVGTREVTLPFWGSQLVPYDYLVSAFGLVGMAAAIFGTFSVGWFAARIGKKTAFIVLFITAILSTGVFFLLQPHQIGWMFFFQILGSLTGGPMSALLWAMYSDTADYGEWKYGRRSTGLVFSASTMCQKFGWAFGIAIATWFLGQAGFVANVEANPEVVRVLVWFMSLVPAGIGLLSLVFVVIYPLGEARMASIQRDLDSRRSAN